MNYINATNLLNTCRVCDDVLIALSPELSNIFFHYQCINDICKYEITTYRSISLEYILLEEKFYINHNMYNFELYMNYNCEHQEFQQSAWFQIVNYVDTSVKKYDFGHIFTSTNKFDLNNEIINFYKKILKLEYFQ